MNSLPLQVDFYLTSSQIQKIILLPANRFRYCIHSDQPDEELEQLILDWLNSYLIGKPNLVKLPLFQSHLSSFNQETLQEIIDIPFGQTASYKMIGEKIGCPKGARAIGNVCRLNFFPLVIPCHRVLTSTGDLGGFAFGLEMKKMLLSFEKIICEAKDLLDPPQRSHVLAAR